MWDPRKPNGPSRELGVTWTTSGANGQSDSRSDAAPYCRGESRSVGFSKGQSRGMRSAAQGRRGIDGWPTGDARGTLRRAGRRRPERRLLASEQLVQPHSGTNNLPKNSKHLRPSPIPRLWAGCKRYRNVWRRVFPANGQRAVVAAIASHRGEVWHMGCHETFANCHAWRRQSQRGNRRVCRPSHAAQQRVSCSTTRRELLTA